jgi:amino acid adenylation domain-containing protein
VSQTVETFSMPTSASVDASPESVIGSTVPELVEQLAAAHPDAVAVTDPEMSLSYSDLDRWAASVARVLRARGVDREVVVGVFLPRSARLVAGALGIMRAGGAYLPLDPDYPADRVAFMLEDAGCPVVLTTQDLAARLPQGPWQPMVLTSIAPAGRMEPAPPVHRPSVDDLAYVIYTSGSTGRPKGVEVTHRGLLNLCAWHRNAFEITARDRGTQAISPAFDPAVNELWPYLSTGASVHVPPDEVRLSADRMRDWLVENRITSAFLPTVLAEAILDQEWPAGTALRYLHTGGDVLHRFTPAGLPFDLVNNYGPTENTVVTSSGVVPRELRGDRLPTIGRPIPGVYVRVLDEELQPVPEGQVGELFVGGASLARGYRNRPDLTAERFIADRYADRPEGRLYRTGDLVRMRRDGEIEFLGRLDNQVKIRGSRVELDEVVAVLDEHPLVRSAVLTVSEDGNERRLNAYVVPIEGTRPPAAELRSFLEERLPAFMIPVTFTLIESLPLTVNGKLDREALPEPRVASEGELAPPRTPVEERLVEIVAGLLELEQVGIDQDFFLLGGHSLLATQIIARIREDYGVEVPLRNLFNARTIEGISTLVEGLLIARLETMSEEEAKGLLL